MLYEYTDEETGEIKKFEQPDEYYDWAGKITAAWNRVVKRIKDGADMTKSNMEYIEEMKKEGFDIYNLIA